MWMSYKQSCLIVNCINIILKSLLDYIYSHITATCLEYCTWNIVLEDTVSVLRSVEQDILHGVYSVCHSLRANVIGDVGR